MRKHMLPVSCILLFWIAVAIANYTPGTWLSGWDTLHPEFDLLLNLKRSFFAVWQEYQGPGLLGGMAHAAALPRELLLLLVSFIVPTSFLRYMWTFAMLLIGPLGSYALSYLTLSRISKSEQVVKLASVAGAAFYLLNLATLQTFFAPFEAFVTHYGFLPWFLWSILNFLFYPRRKNLFYLIGINFLGLTHAYIPTLFLVYMLVSTMLTGLFLLHRKTLHVFKHVVLIYLVIFCINAFWLFPSIFFTFTHAKVTVNAKINQMATEEDFLKNHKYGTLLDTLTLTNFWFENTEFYPQTGKVESVLQEWQTHLQGLPIRIIQYVLVGAVITGAILALRKKVTAAWVLIGLTGFTLLASDTLPFSLVVLWLRTNVPLLTQFFRFPFTKWSTELSLSYSIFFAIFSYYLLALLKNRWLRLTGTSLIIVLTITLAWPMFTGSLINRYMRVSIPYEYFDVFNYFKTQPMGRIANLPQPSFWDWKYYRWGQFGSGFLWYGIKQPILDRAFDVWSRENENYYWELSEALYSKNLLQLESVFQKYDVTYVLFDRNVVTANRYKGLIIDDIENLLDSSKYFYKERAFGNIAIYRRADDIGKNFVSLKSNLPFTAPTYNWDDNDVMFAEYGDYISNQNDPYKALSIDYYYPFRSLFTKRAVDEREFTVEETSENIELLSKSFDPEQALIKPEVTQGISLDETNKQVRLEISKADSLLYDATSENLIIAKNVGLCTNDSSGEFTAEDHSEDFSFVRISNNNSNRCLNKVLNLPHRDAYLVAVEYRHVLGRPLLFAVTNQTHKHTEIETRLSSDHEWTTSYFVLPPLASDGLGYNLYFSNTTIGRTPSVNDIRGLRVYRIPYDYITQLKYVFTDFDDNQNYQTAQVTHPNPAEYWVKISKVSHQKNTTLILSQAYNPGWLAFAKTSTFPYFKQLTNHVLVNNWANGWQIEGLEPSELASRNNDQELNASLSRAKSRDYTLDADATIYIFFWPQILEFVGFALLPIPLFYILKKST